MEILLRLDVDVEKAAVELIGQHRSGLSASGKLSGRRIASLIISCGSRSALMTVPYFVSSCEKAVRQTMDDIALVLQAYH